MPVLDVHALNVYYGESHILRNVDLNVQPGQMVCLIGRNGVGKTTLLKTIIGLLQQRSGNVRFEAKELKDLAPHQRARSGIAYVPQGREIIPQLSVKENLLLGLEALPGGLRHHRHIDPQVFELFPVLEGFLQRRGGDLSGGQQQQLAGFLRALVRRCHGSKSPLQHRLVLKNLVTRMEISPAPGSSCLNQNNAVSPFALNHCGSCN
ncbi:MAG: ATP-binding cassette domain-containing protein [Synechococcaceae bacterium WB6_1B_055]|nr:ATP-binding cassette domain-containing protein [Synechococcaceae bacterium WB6_1B_055]